MAAVAAPAQGGAPGAARRLALAGVWGKEGGHGASEGEYRAMLRTAGMVGAFFLAGMVGACGEDQQAVSDCVNPSGDMKRLIQACAQMIADRPKSALAHNNLCQAYNQVDEATKALPYCNTAIRLDPRNASAYNNRGWAYEIRKEYDLALKDYDKAIELDPKFAVAVANRGDVYAKKGDRDRAILEYRRALVLEPGNDVALSGLHKLGEKP
jgi:tetratricopeptide (TPR) repeat protein